MVCFCDVLGQYPDLSINLEEIQNNTLQFIFLSNTVFERILKHRTLCFCKNQELNNNLPLENINVTIYRYYITRENFYVSHRTLNAFKFTSNLLNYEACSISFFFILIFFYKDHMYKLTENLRNLV